MFVAIVGHDLRNPLGAMFSGTELLELQLVDPRHKKTLAMMSAAGKRMVSMIEQLLDLTRARLGGGVGFIRERSSLDVDDLMHRTIDELRVAHPDREIALDSDGDCTTSGDSERLVQLFSNIVGNALAHGTPGSPVSATVFGSDSEVIVRVHNAGAIPPEQLATLFEPFRGRPKRTSSVGLGLGMYISHQIAVAHGGELVVDSDAVATVVTVRLPRVADVRGGARALAGR
jgi:signal transduction histidine kinase